MNRKAHNPAIGACAFEVRVDDDAIQLFPAGQFDAIHGAMLGKGPWRTDADIAARVIARVAARINDLVIDYEHQTLRTASNGQKAPAAGWVKPTSLEWREGEGIFARSPAWTDTAAAHIEAKEYRYLSPVFLYDPESGEVLDLLHIALTNTAAIEGMQEVGNQAAATYDLSFQPNEENSMNELLKLFGLDPDATEEQAVAAATKLLNQVADLQKKVAANDQAIAAAKAETPEPAMEAIKGLQAEVAALTKKIATAIAKNNLVPTQEQWAKDLGKRDVAALKSYIETAPTIAALGGMQTDQVEFDDDGNPVLTEQQLPVCSQMGIDADDYKKTLAEERNS